MRKKKVVCINKNLIGILVGGLTSDTMPLMRLVMELLFWGRERWSIIKEDLNKIILVIFNSLMVFPDVTNKLFVCTQIQAIQQEILTPNNKTNRQTSRQTPEPKRIDNHASSKRVHNDRGNVVIHPAGNGKTTTSTKVKHHDGRNHDSTNGAIRLLR
jgi:hypothetical protein